MGVVGTGPVGEVRIQPQPVPEERRLGGDGVLGLAVGVLAVAGPVKDVADGIDAAVGEGPVRVDDRRAGVALIRDVAPDVAAAFALGLGHHIMAVRDIRVGSNLQPGSYLVSDLDAAIVHLVGVGVHLGVEQTVVVIQTGGHVVVELVVRAGDGEVVGLGKGEILVQGVVIVRALVVIDPAALRTDTAVGDEGLEIAAFRTLAVLVQPGHGEFHGLVDGGRVAALVVVPGVIEMLRPGITVGHDIRHRRRGLEGEVGLVADRGGPLLGVLRRDEDDAVRGAGSVDGRGSGILEDGYAFNVVRVQQARIALDTVDQDQRAAALSDGGAAADVERRGGVRPAVGELEVQVGDTALEHLRQVGVRTAVKGLFADLVHSPGQVGLLLRTVTDHDGFLQQGAVGRERHIDPAAAADGDLRRPVADALDE